jgi:hypothetical protein
MACAESGNKKAMSWCVGTRQQSLCHHATTPADPSPAASPYPTHGTSCMVCRMPITPVWAFFAPAAVLVVLENNNEHLKQLSAQGLLLLHALLSPLQEVVLRACRGAGPGEPGAAAVPAVRPSAW